MNSIPVSPVTVLDGFAYAEATGALGMPTTAVATLAQSRLGETLPGNLPCVFYTSAPI
ncbi:MAG: hypothetical protein ACR2Q4_06700 [Geminicoccaceae bacterium]